MFKLHSDYSPTGDQPEAIEKLVKGFEEGNQFQTLKGGMYLLGQNGRYELGE